MTSVSSYLGGSAQWLNPSVHACALRSPDSCRWTHAEDTAPRPFRNDIRFQLAAPTFDRHVLLIVLIVSEHYSLLIICSS